MCSIFYFTLQHQFASAKSVKMATDLATSIWNDGYRVTVEALYAELGLECSDFLLKYADERDYRRNEQKKRMILLKTPLSVRDNELDDYAETFGIPSALPTNVKSVSTVRKSKKITVKNKAANSASVAKKRGRPRKIAVKKIEVVSPSVSKKRGRPRKKVPTDYASGCWDD